MADLLQKVFLVFVRPYYGVGETKTIVTTGLKVQTGVTTGGDPIYKEVTTNNTTGDTLSPDKINEEANYLVDPWLLHSSYTSYKKFNEALKAIVAEYGTKYVKCATYIPIDFQILPQE